MLRTASSPLLFLFNHTATSEIYTLSLHDALPISPGETGRVPLDQYLRLGPQLPQDDELNYVGFFNQYSDRKSTRLNSSHTVISYAVFCLKKKKQGADRRARGSGRAQEEHPEPQDA